MDWTHQEYCGHWTEDQLERAAKFKEFRITDLRDRLLAQLEQELAFIKQEQQARKENAR
jgi:hypothetical protein